MLAAGMVEQDGDGSVRDTDLAGLALACVTAVQSFIFAALRPGRPARWFRCLGATGDRW